MASPRLNSKPWFSSALLQSCKRKNSLYRQYLLNPTQHTKSTYNKYRNKYNFLIKTARRKYYDDKLSAVSSDLRKTWSIINQVISKTRTDNQIPLMKDAQGSYSDPLVISNKFNKFFSNIGPSLAHKIPSSSTTFKDFLTGSFSNSMSFSPTSESEVLSIINQLKTSKSEGYDGVCISPIQQAADLLASPLSQICNLSLETGVFPDRLKIAKILPVFKSDDTTNFSNYRPISILPCLSKIFEKIGHKRISQFLLKYNILHPQQYGFRQGLSTYMAILEMVEGIHKGFENTEFTIGIFVDLKKAFDTVNHSILIDKLHFYGIRGITLSWFKSYLSNREQYVQISSHRSSLNHVQCGVPQGSILGPLLFIIYVNDLFNSSQLLSFILFADDTKIFFRHKNIHSLISIVNRELSSIFKWFNSNKLTLHSEKTKFIIFHPPRKKISVNETKMQLNGIAISRTDKTKFLGIIIHQNLSWKYHIAEVCSKVSKVIGILCKSRKYLPPRTLKTQYNSLFLPYLNYCNIIWGSTFLTHLEPLFLLQKRAARIVSGSPPRSHSAPIFQKLKILPIHSIVGSVKANGRELSSSASSLLPSPYLATKFD